MQHCSDDQNQAPKDEIRGLRTGHEVARDGTVNAAQETGNLTETNEDDTQGGGFFNLIDASSAPQSRPSTTVPTSPSLSPSAPINNTDAESPSRLHTENLNLWTQIQCRPRFRTRKPPSHPLNPRSGHASHAAETHGSHRHDRDYKQPRQ